MAREVPSDPSIDGTRRLHVVEAAFFDLDKTVIAKASMVAFGGRFRRAGMIDRRVLAIAVWNGLLFRWLGADEKRMRRFRESTLRVTRGWDHAVVSGLVRDALVDVIEPIVYAEALDLMRMHREAGRLVFLVSASPEEIVAPLAEHLGADGAVASRALLDADGRYTGEVELYAYGQEKVTAIEAIAATHGIDLGSSYAYSDSVTDEPMLRAVGHPRAVNPDRELARIAAADGWPVLHFTEMTAAPRPVRDRLRHPTRPFAVGVVATTVTTLMVIGWLVTRRRRAV